MAVTAMMLAELVESGVRTPTCAYTSLVCMILVHRAGGVLPHRDREQAMDARAKAQAVFDAVQAGQTVFTRATNQWMIVGPTADITPNVPVTVTKANGKTSEVIVTAINGSYTRSGIAYTVAEFRNAPAPVTTVAAAPSPTGWSYAAKRRQGIGSEGIGLYLPTPTDTAGGCYYCGVIGCTDC